MAWVRPSKNQRRRRHEQAPEFHQTDVFQNALQYFSCKPLPPSSGLLGLVDHNAKVLKHPRQRQKAIEGPPGPLLLEPPPPPPPPPAPRHHNRSKTASVVSAARPPQSADHDVVVVDEEDGPGYLDEIRRAVRREMQHFSSARQAPPEERPVRHSIQYESPVLRPKTSPGQASFVRSRPSHHHLGLGTTGAPMTVSSRWAGATSALPGLC